MKTEFKNLDKLAPVAIIGAFWHYVIYCTANGIWYLKELEYK